MPSSQFSGIPAGSLKMTAIPNVIFSELLPLMDDAAQIQVTLHIFYLLSQKKGSPRYVTLEELRGDMTLMQGLDFKKDNLTRGLQKAVACGALLMAEADGAAWYFFNTPESVRVLEKLASGELKLAADVRVVPDEPQPLPNIYKLYEQYIGALSPIIVDELKEAETEYPPEIIMDAFRSAAENNKRSWRYVNKILLDWTRSNKHEKTSRTSTRKRRPVITGKLANLTEPN